MAQRWKNTTEIPTPVLRRMLRWTCKQIGVDPKIVHTVIVRNRSWSRSGHAWVGEILLSVKCYDPKLALHLVELFAHEMWHVHTYRNGTVHTLKRARKCEPNARLAEWPATSAFEKDQDALLALWKFPLELLAPRVRGSRESDAALQAMAEHRRGCPVCRDAGTYEQSPCPEIAPLLAAYRQVRGEAIAAKRGHSLAAARDARAKGAVKREARTRALLATWERKLKAAQRKVKEYQRKVRYYDAKGGER